MLYDLLIRGGAIVTASGVVRGDLAVAEGRIATIGPDLEGTAYTTLDATGLHLFPALIDAHVHCNEPGRTHWEGFATAGAALAAGGGALLCDMPLNAAPPTLDAASFAAKRAAAERVCPVDFALWGGLVPGNLEQLEELAASGAIGFKAFMSNSGMADFAAADDLTLYEGMCRAAQLGRIVAVHAESDQITASLAQRARQQGRVGIRDYLASRPVIAELEAISRAILLAEAAGCALHIVHVSSGRGVALVAAARARGVDVSCETCPHYLLWNEEDLEQLGALGKCAPPLRPASEPQALWQALADGSLPMVASDHSPAPPDLKEFSASDFFTVWGGIAGCQSTLAALLTHGHFERGLALAAIAEATAGFVARRFALAPRKGALAIGADADLALLDLAASYTLRSEDLLYRHRHSPYVGRTFRGRVVATFVRGAAIWQNGTIVPGAHGQLVRPN